MKKKLRLLVTKYCPKSCKGCCNKDWDLDNLPIVTHYKYDEILITGGEPLSKENFNETLRLIDYIDTIHSKPNRQIYIYTSNSQYIDVALHYCDGVTLTLHDQKDAEKFYCRDIHIIEEELETLGNPVSLRLNVFKGVYIPEVVDLSLWKVKKDIEWIPNCPLPEDEVFMRMPNI